MSKKPFYAVAKGYTPGIYDNWEDCQKQTSGYSGAIYKKFNTESGAEKFIKEYDVINENRKEDDEEEYDYEAMVQKDLNDGYVVMFTDGSYDSNKNQSSYGIHISMMEKDKTIKEEEIAEKVLTDKFSESNNISGEVFGVINALNWCLKNEVNKVSIYCDYEGLIKWANEEWRTKTNISKFYLKKIKEYEVMLDIKYTWVKGHSDVMQNERADQLAKNALEKKRFKFKSGKNYFTGGVQNIKEIDSIISLISEKIDIDVEQSEVTNGIKKEIKYLKETLHVTFYEKSRKMLVQGAPGYLYSSFLSYYSDTLEVFDMVRTYSDAYEMTIKKEFVDNYFKKLNLPSDYPKSSQILIKQAISTLKIKKSDEYDYGHYTVPAYRALEGNLRYLFGKAGYHLNHKMAIGGNFDKNEQGEYYLTNKKVKENGDRERIEKCYNHYYQKRHPLLHTGEIGIIDETMLVTSLEEAKDRIKEVLILLKY